MVSGVTSAPDSWEPPPLPPCWCRKNNKVPTELPRRRRHPGPWLGRVSRGGWRQGCGGRRPARVAAGSRTRAGRRLRPPVPFPSLVLLPCSGITTRPRLTPWTGRRRPDCSPPLARSGRRDTEKLPRLARSRGSPTAPPASGWASGRQAPGCGEAGATPRAPGAYNALKALFTAASGDRRGDPELLRIPPPAS